MDIPLPIKNARSITEEVFNSITHGLGALAGLIGLIIGLVAVQSPLSFKIGFVVYSLSLVILMLSSTLYHALTFTRAKYVFGVLDHSSIFILIAGSFTPFVIKLYSGWAQAMLLFAIWGLASFGVVLKATLPRFAKKMGVVPYIALGWLGLLFIPKLHLVNATVLQLLLLGGVLYTVGALLMALKKPFVHVGWHVFVVAAAIAHYFAIIKLA